MAETPLFVMRFVCTRWDSRLSSASKYIVRNRALTEANSYL